MDQFLFLLIYQLDKSSETNSVMALTTLFKSNASYSLVTFFTNLLYLDSNHLSISSLFSYATSQSLMSILSVKGQFAPFGLAMMAACIGESVPLIGVFIAAIIGTFLGNGLAGLGSFIITFIVYFIIVLVFKTKIAVEDRNELIKTGGQLWFSSFIVSMVQNCIGSFTLYDVFTAFIVSAMTYVFYKIFVNGLTFIKDLNIKKAFTIEELVAGVIIISLASVALKGINIFSLNLSNIIMMLMIMILGWQNGVLVGCISGISVGLAVSLVNSTSLFQILMFAISYLDREDLVTAIGSIALILPLLN